MILDALIKDVAGDKLGEIVDQLDHTLSFQNVSGDKWNITVSVDLSSLPEAEKLLLSAVMKHL